jgi:transcriptional regulator GlxA family with amidase domain
MKIAYILFNDITLLDFIGLYDPISRLKNHFMPGLHWDTIAFTTEIKDNNGITLIPDKVGTSLAAYDMVFIPGGKGTRRLIQDIPFMKWIKSANDVPLKTSVCTGSLIWGAAGILQRRKATTHFAEYETLKNFGCDVLAQRIVDDGDTITAGAVASSLDLGLYLCNKWCGPEAEEIIRKKMDYHPANLY